MPERFSISPLRITVLLLLLSIAGLFCKSCNQNDVTQRIPDHPDFNFDIRPILSSNCFLCHGPDASSRESGLRLDTREGATALLKSGKRAIVPGNWEESELIRRVTCPDEEDRMPPAETKKQLSEREISLLKKWIGQGAEWKPYWAFITPRKPLLPPGYQGHPVDYFIGDKLREKGLKPAPEADKNALIRRLTYLLAGLPPTPEEISNFLSDEDPLAYEKLVDRLLASPHFGERWARHWMDLVRYADTRGHEFDYPILGAWRYRDYLIRAFNEDVPYDRFVQEHLAGDLLEQPRFHPSENRNESTLAPAFFTFGEGTHSPVDIRKDEADRIDNMIDVTTKTFQAMTVSCARCHDHKFDPLPTADYYSLYGIMESTRFSLVPARNGLQSLAAIDSIEHYKSLIRRLAAGMKPDKRHGKAKATSLPPESNAQSGDKESIMLGDFRTGTLSGWFSSGLAFGNRNALGEPVLDAENRHIIRLETGKASSRLYGKGIQGALRSPTFIIEKEKVLIRAAGHQSTLRVIIDNFQLIQNPIYGELEKRVDRESMKDYVFDLSMWKGRKAYVEILPGQYVSKSGKGHHFDIASDAWIEAEYTIACNGETPAVPKPHLKRSAPSRNEAVRNWVSGHPSPEDVKLINGLLASNQMTLAATRAGTFIERIGAWSESLHDSTFFAGVTAGDAITSPVFIRGDCHQPAPERQPHRFLTALDQIDVAFPKAGSSRLALAASMTHADNPLTARVMVNRIWHHLFGRGIVETVDNFGLQGKLPSHPELLDYLAVTFMEDGWSVKKAIRRLVLSETFKRSAIASKRSLERDPENLLLQHFPVRRLEAEAIRDGILAVSGELDRTMYGPPFEVYLTGFLEGRGRPSESGELDGGGRRSIYQTIRRNFLPQMMMAFDMPTPFSTFGRRDVSNVPAQSLTLMNDPFVQQQAERWAKRVLKQSTKFEERMTAVYRAAFARTPTGKELEEARRFFAEQLEIDPSADEQTLWTNFCHAMFNTKEFVFLL